MATAIQINTSAYYNAQYSFWFGEWQKIRDCIGGEKIVKSKEKIYLPKTESMTETDYDAFLQRAVFVNATARTVNGLVGTLTRRPPNITGLPDGVSLDDITLESQSVATFSRKIASEVLSVGRYGVLVDMDSTGEGKPYLSGYVAEDIVDWDTVNRNGRYVLARVVLRERIPTEVTPFDIQLKDIYRVLALNENGEYVQRIYGDASSMKTAGGWTTEFTPLKRGLPLNYIPFVFFGPEDNTPDVQRPPMLDIADMNLSMYRSYAMLEQARFYLATPVYVTKSQDGGEDSDFFIGPNIIWNLGVNEDAYIIEFNGKGLSHLENAVTDKLRQISILGGRMLTSGLGSAAESTESTSLREKNENSILLSAVQSMSEGMTKLLREWLDWQNFAYIPLSVEYQTDLTSNGPTARELRAVQGLWDSGLVPIEALYGVLRDAGIVPNTMSLAEFKGSLPEVAPSVTRKIAEKNAVSDFTNTPQFVA